MLHLFKRVYLALDETLDTAQHRVVLSQDFGHPMGGEFASVGQLLDYNESVEGVIGAGKTYPDYLSFLNFLGSKQDELNAPVTVYADRDSFVKIGTNFFRAALPLATVKDIYQILAFYTVRQSLLSSNVTFSSPVQNHARLKNKAAITEAEVSAEFFKGQTNPVDFYSFFAEKRADLSIEFVLATYSYNGQCEDIFSEQIKGFCIKHAYLSALEAREHIVDTLTSEKTKSVLNLSDRPILEMIGILQQAESTRLLFDDRFFPRDVSTVSFDANWRRVSESEIAKLSKTVIKVFRDLKGLPLNEVPIGFFPGIEHINNPAQWSQYRDRVMDVLPFIASSESHKINATLFNYINDARKNNRELLRPFVINGCT
jgi:hypothetical protein